MSKSTIKKLNQQVNAVYEEAVNLSEKLGMTPTLEKAAISLSDLLDLNTEFNNNPSHENYFKLAGAIIKSENILKKVYL